MHLKFVVAVAFLWALCSVLVDSQQELLEEIVSSLCYMVCYMPKICVEKTQGKCLPRST